MRAHAQSWEKVRFNAQLYVSFKDLAVEGFNNFNFVSKLFQGRGLLSTSLPVFQPTQFPASLSSLRRQKLLSCFCLFFIGICGFCRHRNEKAAKVNLQNCVTVKM